MKRFFLFLCGSLLLLSGCSSMERLDSSGAEPVWPDYTIVTEAPPPLPTAPSLASPILAAMALWTGSLETNLKLTKEVIIMKLRKTLALTAATVCMFSALAFPASAETPDTTQKTHLAEGLKNGLVSGMKNGTADGMKNGLVSGMKTGMTEGLKDGIVNGLKNGLSNGLVEGLKSGLVNGNKK